MEKNILASFAAIKSRIKERRLLLSYLQILILAVIIPICVIAIWFFSNVYNIMEKNVDVINRQGVKNISAQLNSMVDDLEKLAFKMENTAFFYTAPFERDTLLSVDTFKMYHNVNRHLSSIAIVYTTTNKVLTTTGTTELDLFLLGIPQRDELIDQIFRCSQPRFFSSVAYGEDYLNSKLLYVCPLPRQSNNPIHFAVFTITGSAIHKVISTSHNAGPENRAVILDPQGQLLWSNIPFSGEDMHSPLWMEQNFSSERSDFYLEQPLSYGLNLIYSIERDANLDILKTTLTYFILCCFIILTLGAVMMFINIHITYRPIGRLVKNIKAEYNEVDFSENEIETINRALTSTRRIGEDMQSNLNANISDLRSLFVINAIRGRFVNEESLKNVCLNLQIDIDANYYFCCCILLDNAQNKGGIASNRDGELMAEAVRLISLKIKGYFYHCFGFAMTVGIICCNSDTQEDRMGLMNLVQQEFASVNMTTVTLSCGGAYEDFLNVGRSYIEAKSALDYRFIKGGGTIISSDEINPNQSKANAYHAQLIETFATDVRSLDFKRICQNLEHIMTCIRNGSYSLYQTKCICFDLVSTFLSEVNQMSSRVSVNLYRTFNVFSIAEFESIDELIDSLKLLSRNIADFLQSSHIDTVEQRMEEYIDYLKSNLANNQFLIETMAEHFGISVQQMRKEFKEQTGRSIIEQFNDFKMEYAKKQLMETDDDISTIVHNIGYTDISSFIRKFRTQVGMTPGKYRMNYKK